MLLLLSSGCGSLAVPRIEQPNVDSQSAAAEAIRLYDKEADGRLNSAELSACPAISLDKYDQDSDGFVSEDEVAARLLTIFSTNAGLLEVRCRITLGGRPLSGATLRLIPEPFLANALHAAEGTTDANGTAVMSIPSEQLPPHLQNDQLPKHLAWFPFHFLFFAAIANVWNNIVHNVKRRHARVARTRERLQGNHEYFFHAKGLIQCFKRNR
jgi:hypothetical protein